MHRKLWIVGLLVLLSLALLAPTAYARGLADDKVIFGENYVLRSGERLDGNLAVIGGKVTLERDSIVTDDVAVMGGALTVAGSVRGSVAVFGGTVILDDSAVIEGDLAVFGGSIERAAGAVVQGDVFGPRLPAVPLLPGVPELPQAPTAHRGPFDLLVALFRWQMWTLGLSLCLVLLGIVALLVAPKEMARIVGAVATEPAVSFGVGLLTLVVACLGGALLLIACGLGLLIWLIAGFALLLGWLAVGLWAGQRLLRALKVADASALAEMALGVFLITVLARLPFCVGFLCLVVIGATGLGAVVLTRFGTQSYSHSAGGAPAASPPPSSGILMPASAPQTDLAAAPDAEPPLVPDESPAAAAPVVPLVLPAELSGPAVSLMDDDLEIVIGVGPDEASRLRAAGVRTLAELAAADPAILGPAIGVPVERIVSEDWIGQARRL
jgi:predicted flap endonuclease-1-like 5' DNA nuclease/cytoskeletal protein CcmA (bactofilin family)